MAALSNANQNPSFVDSAKLQLPSLLSRGDMCSSVCCEPSSATSRVETHALGACNSLSAVSTAMTFERSFASFSLHVMSCAFVRPRFGDDRFSCSTKSLHAMLCCTHQFC